MYWFKGVFMLQLADLLHAAPSLEPTLRHDLLRLVANSSDAVWALRSVPPWPSHPLDACADPALAHLEHGPPKFPMFWRYLPAAATDTTGPNIVCRDARTQISALSLFVATCFTPA
jgi:hypothetical protein